MRCTTLISWLILASPGCGSSGGPPASSSATPAQMIGASEYAAFGAAMNGAVSLLFAQRMATPGALDPMTHQSGDGTVSVTATAAQPAADAESFDARVSFDRYPSADWVFTTSQPIALTIELTRLPAMPLGLGYLDGALEGRIAATSASLDDEFTMRVRLHARVVEGLKGNTFYEELYVDGQTVSPNYGTYSAGVDVGP